MKRGDQSSPGHVFHGEFTTRFILVLVKRTDYRRHVSSRTTSRFIYDRVSFSCLSLQTSTPRERSGYRPVSSMKTCLGKLKKRR